MDLYNAQARLSRQSDSYVKAPSQSTAVTPVTREHKKQQRQCLENMLRLKKAIGVLEEKFAKQKKVDAESYHFQFWGLNSTNAKVMKATHQQLIQKKKDFNSLLGKLKDIKSSHALHGIRREHGYHHHIHH